jgi:hypothetical protein
MHIRRALQAVLDGTMDDQAQAPRLARQLLAIAHASRDLQVAEQLSRIADDLMRAHRNRAQRNTILEKVLQIIRRNHIDVDIPIELEEAPS